MLSNAIRVSFWTFGLALTYSMKSSFALLASAKISISSNTCKVWTLYFAVILSTTYKPPFIKYDDNKSVADFIKRIEYQEEPILFHDKFLVLTFNQVYTGNNRLTPIPEIIFDYHAFDDDLKDTTELKHAIEITNVNLKSFLFISGNDIGWLENKKLTNKMIDSYFKNNYTISIDTTFKGIDVNSNLRVRRLYKKSISN